MEIRNHNKGYFLIFLIIGVAILLLLLLISFFLSQKQQGTLAPTQAPSNQRINNGNPGASGSSHPSLTPSHTPTATGQKSPVPSARASGSPTPFNQISTANYASQLISVKYPTSWTNVGASNASLLGPSATFYQPGADGSLHGQPRMMIRTLGSNETYDSVIQENLDGGYQKVSCQLTSVTCTQVQKLLPYQGDQFESDIIIAKTASNTYMISFGYLLDDKAAQNKVIIQGMLASLVLK